MSVTDSERAKGWSKSQKRAMRKAERSRLKGNPRSLSRGSQSRSHALYSPAKSRKAYVRESRFKSNRRP
jgi:hypothetical protein